MNTSNRTRSRQAVGLTEEVVKARLTPELMDVLDLYSAQTGLSKAALIRESVGQWAFRLGALPSPDVPLTTYRTTPTKENEEKA